jgi:hypothetical protein
VDVLSGDDGAVDDLDRRLHQRLTRLQGVTVGESMFGNGEAFWVNGREIAHFEAHHVIEVRLTKAAIRERRPELKADTRVVLRPSGADWITVQIAGPEDIGFVVGLVVVAEEAHRPPEGVAAKPPPTGSDLERRRRFH